MTNILLLDSLREARCAEKSTVFRSRVGWRKALSRSFSWHPSQKYFISLKCELLSGPFRCNKENQALVSTLRCRRVLHDLQHNWKCDVWNATSFTSGAGPSDNWSIKVDFAESNVEKFNVCFIRVRILYGSVHGSWNGEDGSWLNVNIWMFDGVNSSNWPVFPIWIWCFGRRLRSRRKPRSWLSPRPKPGFAAGCVAFCATGYYCLVHYRNE